MKKMQTLNKFAVKWVVMDTVAVTEDTKVMAAWTVTEVMAA